MSDAQEKIRQFQVKELSRRNGETAQQGLRELDNRMSELHAIIVEQQRGVMALQQRVMGLEAAAINQKVAGVGTGPTAR